MGVPRLGHALCAVAVLLALALLNPQPVQGLDCSTFNPANITLVTFDVFAALMDIFTSLNQSVGELLPFLSKSEVKQFVDTWVYAYGHLAGHVFSPSQTDGMEPFVYTSYTNLIAAIQKMGLQQQIPTNGTLFRKLMSTWGNLEPWAGTTETMHAVSKHFRVAPLSNGDHDTLARATSIFAPDSTMSFIFSSNYPVGSFKPDARMYAQVVDQVPVENVLHVAGAPEDARGARVFGMYSALTWNSPLPGDQPCFLLPNITHLLSVLNIAD